MPCRYHYHLGFHLPRARSTDLQQRLAAMGESAAPPPNAAPLFLSLCRIAESALPHPFLRQRCATAFDRPLPPAVDFHFRAIRLHQGMARLEASGKMEEATALMERLRQYLTTQGLSFEIPSGERPSIVIGPAPQKPSQPVRPQLYLWQWTPMELALIEWDAHLGQHRSLNRWTLDSPRQPSFLFDDHMDAA